MSARAVATITVFVAYAAAALLWFYWPGKRDIFPDAVTLLAITASAVVLVTSVLLAITDFLELNSRYTWRNTWNPSAVFCLAAWVALGLLKGAEVGGLLASPTSPLTSFKTNLPSTASDPLVWTELTPDGGLLARALVAPVIPCPAAEIGGNVYPMRERLGIAPNSFAVRVCQLHYNGTAPIRISGRTLPERPKAPKSILVLGDSGCRIGWWTEPQACADDALWPFQRIVAAAMRTTQPDLIIHVGDYHYRESPCAAPSICGDSPFGDTWPAWLADFFAPAATLLPVAPWVMLRGNHEDCSRAGAGWFYFLDVSDTVPSKGCSKSANGYVLNFDNLAMAVLDTAHASDMRDREDRIEEYKKVLEGIYLQLAPASSKNLWLLVHQPLWSSFGHRKSGGLVENYRENKDDKGRDCKNGDLKSCEPQDPLDALRRQVALENRNGLRPKISLVLSGDTHLFQFFGAVQPEAPAQLVVGTSGDILESETEYYSMLNPSGEDATLYQVNGHLLTRKTFGFVLLTRADPDSGWIATFYDMYGEPLVKCSLYDPRCSSGDP